MGHSQYDLAGQGRPAWNAGKRVGVKRPLKVRQKRFAKVDKKLVQPFANRVALYRMAALGRHHGRWSETLCLEATSSAGIRAVWKFSGHVPPNWLAIVSREHRARLADDRDMVPGGLARGHAVSAHDCGDNQVVFLPGFGQPSG